MPRGELRLFACRAGRHFGERVADDLLSSGCSKRGLEVYSFKEFECGENKQHGILESVRGADVYLFQSGSRDLKSGTSVDDQLMELYRFANGMENANAGSITAIFPYLPYSRQDKIWERGEPYSAVLTAALLKTSGVNRVITADLHADQIRGFYSALKMHMEPIHASYVFLDELRKFYSKRLNDFVFASTDAGGGERAKHYQKKVPGSGLAFGSKIKSYTAVGKVVEKVDVVGDVSGRDVMIVEDMIDTGGSLLRTAEIAKKKGAKSIVIVAAHGLFSGGAERKLGRAHSDGLIERIWCTDSVFHSRDFLHNNSFINEVSLAPLFSQVIQKLHHGDGVSEVYRD